MSTGGKVALAIGILKQFGGVRRKWCSVARAQCVNGVMAKRSDSYLIFRAMH
jgi:putative effector of murein hydrolase